MKVKDIKSVLKYGQEVEIMSEVVGKGFYSKYYSRFTYTASIGFPLWLLEKDLSYLDVTDNKLTIFVKEENSVTENK